MIRGLNPGREKPKHPDRHWSPQQSLIQKAQEFLSPGLKRPGREPDNSPKYIAVLKNDVQDFSFSHMSSCDAKGKLHTRAHASANQF
jgi:hypothetical protein